jgi:hypothetical protein
MWSYYTCHPPKTGFRRIEINEAAFACARPSDRVSEVTPTTCRTHIGRQDRVCRHVAGAIEALKGSRRTGGSIMIWRKGNVAIGLGHPSWHIGSEMCAATFSDVQRGYHDHQAH